MFHGLNINGKSITTNTVWPINRRLGEINVTNACNLRCPNCQASCNIAPTEEFIEVSHVEKFVEDSIRLNHFWDKIKCTGGEAAVHPKLSDIVKCLKPYKDFHPKCEIIVLSNGTDFSKQKLSSLPNWCKIQSQETLDNKSWEIFESAHVAPIDLPEYKDLNEKVFKQGCCRITICGGCTLGTNGLYYPCNILYHINRIFDLNIGIENLDKFLASTEDELRNMLKLGCRVCGYFKYPRDVVEKQTTSPTWEKAFKDHKEKNEKYPFQKYKTTPDIYQIKL